MIYLYFDYLLYEYILSKLYHYLNKVSFLFKGYTIDNIDCSGQYSKNGTYDVTVSGYKTLGVVGHQVGNASTSGTAFTFASVLNIGVSNNKIYYQIGNTNYPNDLRCKLIVTVAYYQEAS